MTTWNEEVFQMLKSRLRCEHSHFDGTCNPDNPRHWFKTFLESDADVYQQSYQIEDGVLPASVINELKKEYAGTVYYNRYILGEWAAAEGIIYRAFADDPERFIIEPATVDFSQAGHYDLVRGVIGVDFGGGSSAHAFCCVGFTRGYRDLVVLADYREKEALDPDKLGTAFADFARSCRMRWPVTDVYCDSAEQTLINGLRTVNARERLGLNISNARKKPINDRIRALCILMSAGRFKINRECTHTIEALTSAVWDSKRLTEDVRLDNGTTNVDNLDALEYCYERDIPTLIERWR